MNTRRRAYIAATWLTVLTLLTACESGPITQGRLARVEILSCEKLTAEHLQAQVATWQRMLVDPNESAESESATPDWQAAVERTLRRHSGVILDITIEEKAEVDIHRWFGEPTKLTVGDWVSSGETETVFLAESNGSCADVQSPPHQFVWLNYGSSGDAPFPSHPTGFLLPALEPVPELLEPFLPAE